MMGPDWGTYATDVGLPVTTDVKVTGTLETVLTTRGSHEEYKNNGSAVASWSATAKKNEMRNPIVMDNREMIDTHHWHFPPTIRGGYADPPIWVAVE